MASSPGYQELGQLDDKKVEEKTVKSPYIEPGSFSKKLECNYCGLKSLYSEDNFLYKYGHTCRGSCKVMEWKTIVICFGCDKDVFVGNVPVIVRERMKTSSMFITCFECKKDLSLDDAKLDMDQWALSRCILGRRIVVYCKCEGNRCIYLSEVPRNISKKFSPCRCCEQ